MKKDDTKDGVKVALIIGFFFFILTEFSQATKVTATIIGAVSGHANQLYKDAGPTLFYSFLVTIALWCWSISHHLVFRKKAINRITELESYGIIDIQDRARDTIYQSLTEPRKSFFWHGYSSVNVVGQVENERAIRHSSKTGVKYHFNILDPSSLLGCLIHSIHEQNNDDQGRGYIKRATSVIREMQKDGIGIDYTYYYLPPIFRIVIIDNETMHIAIYPQGQCGIDSQEVILKQSPTSPLFDFFQYFSSRYTEIGEYLKLRDIAFAALLNALTSKEEMPFLIDGLTIPGAGSDHMRILRAELLDIMDRSTDVTLRWTPSKSTQRTIGMAEERIVNEKLQKDLQAYRNQLGKIAMALASHAELKLIDVSSVGQALGVGKGKNMVAVRIPTKGVGGKRRAYSGWVTHAVVQALNAQPERNVQAGVLSDTRLNEVTQFSFSSEFTDLISWGDNPQSVVDAAIDAAKTFDPTKFDEDGYSI